MCTVYVCQLCCLNWPKNYVLFTSLNVLDPHEAATVESDDTIMPFNQEVIVEPGDIFW